MFLLFLPYFSSSFPPVAACSYYLGTGQFVHLYIQTVTLQAVHAANTKLYFLVRFGNHFWRALVKEEDKNLPVLFIHPEAQMLRCKPHDCCSWHNLAEEPVLFLLNATCFVYNAHKLTGCQSGGCCKRVLLSGLDLWSTPLVPKLEESVLLSITLSGALIACRFQTIHPGCNYVEELKTDFCQSS